MTQDIQAGLRFEKRQGFTNRNFFGNQRARFSMTGTREGLTTFNRAYSADAYFILAFVQTAIHVTRDFSVDAGRAPRALPRRSRYLRRQQWRRAKWRSEVDCDLTPVGGTAGASRNAQSLPRWLEDDDITRSESFTKGTCINVLPGVALAYTGLYRSTVYGGYHRGLSMHVLREEAFPAKDEIGDNFQIGVGARLPSTRRHL